MKAVVINQFGGSDVLEMRELPKPTPGKNEVLVKVIKTSVNYADIKNRTGSKAKPNFPMILGLDAAGIIEEVGSNVTEFKKGDRVICFPKSGSYAEFVVVTDQLTYKIPETLDFTIAAASPIVSFLAYKLTHDLARIEEGDTVLVHSAAGGVGSTIIQMAKILGAKKVIGTVSDLEKSELPLSLGADHVCTYDYFEDNVNEWTDQKGVNVIFDSHAGEITERSLNVLAKFGRLIHFGNSSGKVGTVKTKDLHSSCRSIIGFSLGTTRKENPQSLKKVAEEVFKIMSDNQLNIRVGAQFPLREIDKAHELLSSRKSLGKIVINVSKE